MTTWPKQGPDTLAVTGNEAVAEAMRQIEPGRRLRVPHHPADRGGAALRADGGRRQGGHRVRHRGIGALGHERRHRLGGRRGAHHDGHLVPGLRPHVGTALRGRQLPPAHRHDDGQPRPFRPHQHPLRPQRHHGRPRHGLDPDLRRGPPAGLRQLPAGHPHRRAHGRAHADHAHVRRLRHQRRHRPAGHAQDEKVRRVHRPVQGRQPHARHGAPGHRGPLRRPARLVLRAQGLAEPGHGQGLQGDRKTWPTSTRS